MPDVYLLPLEDETTPWFEAGLTRRAMSRPTLLTRNDMDAHTDHPLRHYDRTCPGCASEASGPDDVIDALWGASGHGTRREDIVAAYEAGAAAERKRWAVSSSSSSATTDAPPPAAR